jgi:hypothetical protein
MKVRICTGYGTLSGQAHPSRMPAPPTSSALATTSGGSNFALQIQSVDDLARLARVFAASGLFGRNGNQETQIAECAIRLMAGLEAGFSPFASATGVHIINGKPAFSANLLAQAVRRHPVYDYRVLEKSATVCRIRFLAAGETLGDETFTIEMAERAGLLKNPTWRSYPEAMLFARALTAGMRAHCPDALNGAAAYTPEELGSTQPAEPVQAVQVAEVQQQAPSLSQQAYAACADAGLSDDGLAALVAELSNGTAETLDDLPDDILRRLATAGVSAETVARCNTAAMDDLPATWAVA